jgi:hypothetical protein
MILTKLTKQCVFELLEDSKTKLNLNLLKDIKEVKEVENLIEYLDIHRIKYDLSDFRIDIGTQALEKGDQYKIFHDYVRSLTATEFEQLCAKLVHIFGYTKSYATKTSHDQGIDFIASREYQHFKTNREELIIGQCKNNVCNDVDVKEVRELAGAIMLLRHNEFSIRSRPYGIFKIKSLSNITGVFFSSCFYTNPAIELCNSADIIPFTIFDIICLINKGANEGIFDIKLSNGKIDEMKLKKLHTDIEIIS